MEEIDIVRVTVQLAQSNHAHVIVLVSIMLTIIIKILNILLVVLEDMNMLNVLSNIKLVVTKFYYFHSPLTKLQYNKKKW